MSRNSDNIEWKQAIDEAAERGVEISDAMMGGVSGGALKEEYIAAFTDEMLSWPRAYKKLHCPECFSKGTISIGEIIAYNKAGTVGAFSCKRCGCRYVTYL